MNIKEYKFQILAWGLCAVLGICLISVLLNDQKKSTERNLQLQQQAQESEKAFNEKLERQSKVYDELYSELEVPEIICWGDNLMRGDNGGSFISSLNTVTNKNLFKSLTNSFHYVIENGRGSAPSVSVLNMGVVNEDMRQILARAGVNTVYLGEDINILSSKEPILVKLTDEEVLDRNDDGNELLFANQNSNKIGKVTISGIEGTLEETDEWYDSTHPRYAFVRGEEGDPKSVESGTQVEIEKASMYIGCIPIFFFENDSGNSVVSFMSDLNKLVRRYASTQDEIDENHDSENFEENTEVVYDLPFVVICRTKEDSDLDKALKNEFGESYIRTEHYSNEMSESTFRSLSQQVYDILDEEGCFTNTKNQILEAIEEVNDL